DATCTVRAYAWAGPTSDPLRCRNILNHRLLADLHTAGFGPATPTLPARPPSPCTAPDRTPLRSPMSLVPASR
ncbi:MAG: hypothetical protein OEY23_22720, partial [Acidimicrobiia bacterium]|nr:hypothetical protein [Acidimicrobiia bacterium]